MCALVAFVSHNQKVLFTNKISQYKDADTR
jgi:hypothetical protein